MPPQAIELVRESWSRVLPIADTAGRLFYARLFAADPSLRAMFRGDIDEQAARLMQMIDAAVRKLDDPEVLVPVLRQLGQRHRGYGVLPEHYDVVGAALIGTLRQGLGASFTAEVEAAWGTVYGVMAEVMIAASGDEG